MVSLTTGAPPAGITVDQVWDWLAGVADPEIPVLSVVDLGIVRRVELLAGQGCTLTLTPTYSGCPAMEVIAQEITVALQKQGLAEVRLVRQLSPAWTTDWLTERGRRQLRAYGVAPPAQQVIDISGLIGGGVRRRALPKPTVLCPVCASSHTQLTSQFGSTPCKALYKCSDCGEPFDYFKCH